MSDRQSGGNLFWEKMADHGCREVRIDGRTLKTGSRVRLRPHPGGDLLDLALSGRLAVIEGTDEDDSGGLHIAVTLVAEEGWDLDGARHPARRYFFSPEELESVDGCEEGATHRKVLVAGIGNIFLGDDGFGVAVVQRLLQRKLPAGIEAADFGIRGMDLAYALGRPYSGAILVDAVPRGRPPGSLFVMEPKEIEAGDLFLNGHGMDPLAVLRLACRLGTLPQPILIIGCEPARVCNPDSPFEMSINLSNLVAAAVEPAVELVLERALKLLACPSLDKPG